MNWWQFLKKMKHFSRDLKGWEEKDKSGNEEEVKFNYKSKIIKWNLR